MFVIDFDMHTSDFIGKSQFEKAVQAVYIKKAIARLAFYYAFTWIFIHKNEELLASKRSWTLDRAIANPFLVNARWISNCSKGYTYM